MQCLPPPPESKSGIRIECYTTTIAARTPTRSVATKQSPDARTASVKERLAFTKKPAETNGVLVESQKNLQDSIERLEQLVQDLSIANTSSNAGRSS